MAAVGVLTGGLTTGALRQAGCSGVLTVETVSRTFTKLRQSGIIDLAHSSHVVIKDRHALEQLAAGEASAL